MTHNMGGALIAGVCAAIWGWPGLIVGLALALLYYGRSNKT